jgi:hypothetical protein
LGHAHILCVRENRIICCQIFCDLLYIWHFFMLFMYICFVMLYCIVLLYP